MPLLLDAAYTLIYPTQQVGQAYARHLEAASGLAVDPEVMHAAFKRIFASTPPPDYSLHPFGQATERAWWRDLVAAVLRDLPGEAAKYERDAPESFDAFFTSLFDHFSTTSAWSLYPETIEFLEAASKLGPLAVVSNFDDRLAPILNGLGIGPYFEFIFTSADARARKPDRAIFDLALDRLNCAPAETYHCGDSYEADFEGASALGLHAFHLQRPKQTLLDFLAYCQS